MIKKSKIGIYLLPNVLTTFGLFAGFFAIILAFKGQYSHAAIAIFAAMLWDGLDGRVARLTNTESDFGGQYDSMADMVSFGVAPALLMYFLAFTDMGNIGWIGSFIYVTSGALRLARFNTQIGIADKRYFQGLPSPAAAALVAGMVWLQQNIGYIEQNQYLVFLNWVVLVVSGLLMVSNFRYYSFKEINLKGRASFRMLLIAAAIIIVVTLEPSVILFGFFFIYAVSGPVMTIVEVRKKRKLKKIKKKTNKKN